MTKQELEEKLGYYKTMGLKSMNTEVLYMQIYFATDHMLIDNPEADVRPLRNAATTKNLEACQKALQEFLEDNGDPKPEYEKIYHLIAIVQKNIRYIRYKMILDS